MRTWVMAALAAGVACGTARADEVERTTVIAGAWMAGEHSPNETAQPDICVAVNDSAGIVLRATNDAVEFRVINNSWALPSDVAGLIRINVAKGALALQVVGNDATSVAATVPQSDVAPLLDAMASASEMTVNAGSAKPLAVSLAGSGKALTAFRTCAGISGSSGGGDNPFAAGK